MDAIENIIKGYKDIKPNQIEGLEEIGVDESQFERAVQVAFSGSEKFKLAHDLKGIFKEGYVLDGIEKLGSYYTLLELGAILRKEYASLVKSFLPVQAGERELTEQDIIDSISPGAMSRGDTVKGFWQRRSPFSTVIQPLPKEVRDEHSALSTRITQIETLETKYASMVIEKVYNAKTKAERYRNSLNAMKDVGLLEQLDPAYLESKKPTP